jgi:predicted RNase H-related nuclease YkuK (DUF458 family)
MMLRPALVEEIKRYLNEVSPESKVYIGCDSSRRKSKQGEWSASYSTAIVVHMNNSKGCKVFCDTENMQDYDQRHDRPFLRMMNEAYKSIEAYQQLEDELILRDVEVHLDINESAEHGSNCALSSARGVVLGTIGCEVRAKPHAFAASYAADHGVRGGFSRAVH